MLAPSNAHRNDRRPAAPIPPARRLKFLALWRLVRDNPIATVPQVCYEKPAVWLGRRWRPLLILSEPAAIERVLIHNAANYRKSDQQQRRLQPALGDGLVTAEGETWRCGRRIAAPLFSPKAIVALIDDMTEATAGMSQRWQADAAAGPLDLTAEYQRLTYDIVSRTVFSGALDNERVTMRKEMARYFDTIGRVDLATLLSLPQWFPTLAQLRAASSIAIFRKVVRRVTGDRLAARAKGVSFGDLLDRLSLARDPQTGQTMPDATVSDNVLTFLAAGQETTANALTWVSYLLAMFPETAERMTEEFQRELAGRPAAAASLERLTFSRAVVEEALRLYPPAAFLGREAVGPDVLAGEPVVAGTPLMISPWVVHRHRLLWEEPDQFDPERFSPARRGSIARGAYIPFGLGPRICIGMGFAMQEILTVLSIVVPRFRFALPAGAEVVPRSRITLAPRDNLMMIVTPRG
jgi:cytochrome P450